MKTILLTATLIFLISCNGIAPDQELKTLIEDYQNFKNQNDSNYPLGDFRESTIETVSYTHLTLPTILLV